MLTTGIDSHPGGKRLVHPVVRYDDNRHVLTIWTTESDYLEIPYADLLLLNEAVGNPTMRKVMAWET